MNKLTQEYEEGYHGRFGRAPTLVRNTFKEKAPQLTRRTFSGTSTATDSALQGGLPPIAAVILEKLNGMAPSRERASSGGPLTGAGLARERYRSAVNNSISLTFSRQDLNLFLRSVQMKWHKI